MSMKNIYLDNAATTKASPEAVRAMEEALSVNFGNPSSKHIMGMNAEKYIRDAAETIAKTLKVKPKEITFTSGGTESNNLALIGSALANKRRGMHIIASAFEHPSVYNPLLFLQEMGFEIDFAPVDGLGHIKLDKLLSMIREDTILVSIMYVNNEIGAVQNIAELSKAIKEKSRDILLHVDAIQAYGKLLVYPKRENIDLMSVSAHKLHGPKGAGFLYVSEGVKIKPVIYGGGQQGGMRSGTENVPAIAGFAAAVKQVFNDIEAKREHMYSLKKHFIGLVRELEGVQVNAVSSDLSDLYDTAPHIISVSFEGIDRSEVLLHALEDKGVYVSSGSACSSNHPGISGTLKSIGLPENLLSSTLRFSLCDETTKEDIDYTAECLNELLPILRRFKRK